MPSAGALPPPVITPLRMPDFSKPSNHISTDTLIKLDIDTLFCKLYFTTDGSRPDPFIPRAPGGKETTFRYKGPFTLKPGRRTVRALAMSSDGVKESAVVTKTFQVENPQSELDKFFAGLDDVNTVELSSSSEWSSDSEINFWQQRSDSLRRSLREAKKQEKKEKQKRREEKERRHKKKHKKDSDSSSSSSESESDSDDDDHHHKKKKGKNDKDRKKDKKSKSDKDDEKKKDTKKASKKEDVKKKDDSKKPEKKNPPKKKVTAGAPKPNDKKDEAKDNKKKEKEEDKEKSDESDKDKKMLALEPAKRRNVWGAMDTQGNNDVDGPFNPVNYSGTQINLWGMPPEMITELAVSNGAATLKRDPNATGGGFGGGGGAVTAKQLGAVTNQVMQKLDETHEMTVKDVRLAVEDMKKKATAAIQAPPKPAADVINGNGPTLMPVSPGNGQLRKQLSHVYAHLIDYCKRDQSFKAAISEPQIGKILNADFDEGESSYLITIEMVKPGAKPKPQTKKEQPKPETKRKPSVSKPKEETKKPPKKEKPPEEYVPFFETEDYEQEGTLKPADPFNKEADCEKLRKAMKGLGTDEQAIIDVLGYRISNQRQEIVKQFKTMFGKDLISELKSEISGQFLATCKALCLPPDEYDASELRKAMKGLGTDEDTLIEIICTRTNAQLNMIKQTYKKLYSRDVEKDVESETSGHYKRLLISCLQANRDENTEFDRNAAKADAQKLYEAGEKKWGTDESQFNVILMSKSYPHLRAVFEEYKTISKKNIEEAIESEMSGDLKTGMLTVVRCIKYKPSYFAQALHKAMKGLGTNDDVLVRIVVSRCELDMVQIKGEFQKLYNDTLANWITDDISGDYRKIILALIGEPLKK
ncbi:uncharacterized protein LOC141907047 [Tubulanus polymorphus]|uniref:uncharacterized protein LOC141907047 n=1 Tax=Tubulanus polymorphus TaxID=672921 RepID=UPI003DA54570